MAGYRQLSYKKNAKALVKITFDNKHLENSSILEIWEYIYKRVRCFKKFENSI